MIGKSIGPYQVLAELGRGGMGEVFRARDTKLHRDVALKILPDAVAHDRDRLARFEREAYVLASLNHPNIGQIHGLEEFDGRKAIVLELVEGPTLAERIAEGRLPLDEALTIARHIADALGAAHDAGIVHRDLKPANVKIRPDGVVKVLDFGLAKPLDAPGSGGMANSPTVTSPALTEQGVILGTAAYMSPEQARGRAADKRADVWAFGVVLLEMVTGTRPFAGEDVSETLAAILKVEPELSGAPPRIRRLIRRCLEKDPRRRLHDIHDVWDLLEDEPAPSSSAPQMAVRLRYAAVAAIVGLVTVAFFVGRGLAPRQVSTSLDARRFRITTPAGVTLPAMGPNLALSPDGKMLVYRGQGEDGVVRLYRRPLGSLESTPIAGTENVRYQGPPFFSPDGNWLAFALGNKLLKVNLNGGQPEVVAELPRGGGQLQLSGWNWGGGSWGDDGTIVLGLWEAGLVSVPAAGGTPTVLAESSGFETWFRDPQIVPDGRAVLFTAAIGVSGSGELRLYDRQSHAVRTLLRGFTGRVLPTGHLIFARGGTLWSAPFDLNRLDVSGEPKPVERGVRTGLGTAWLDVARDGTLAYVAGDAAPTFQDTLVWVDRRGNETPIPGLPLLSFSDARLSPANDRVAVSRWSEEGLGVQVWDFTGLTPLTARRESNRMPVWSPDGTRLAYGVQEAGREQVYWQPWDQPDAATVLTDNPLQGALPTSFSPDGTRLVTQSTSTPPTVGVHKLGDAGRPATLEHSFSGNVASVSPDGHWIAYQSQETGRSEVWVRPFPDVSVRGRQVSKSGGSRPAWSPSTDELFYIEPSGGLTNTGGQLVVVPFAHGNPPSGAWSIQPLFSTAPYALRVWRNYDVSKDAQRFLILKNLPTPESTRPPDIVIVEHWSEDLRRLVPSPGR